LHRLWRLRSACPVEAIFADSDVPEKWSNYTQINADYFQKSKHK